MSSKKIEKYIQAPLSEVYLYLTNSTALREWLCDGATTDSRPGGHFYLWWTGDYYTSGKYLALEKDKSVSFTWLGRDEPHATQVDITLKYKKPGTMVKLDHHKIGKGKPWDVIASTYEKEWTNALENLASVLESGADLRITRRPLLGIYFEGFDQSIAEKLGVPVFEGLRLGGVMEGLGAQKAGFKGDDIIIEVDGHSIKGIADLSILMNDKHAGDIIAVTFYRETERKTVPLTLSGRENPPLPASGSELANHISLEYKHIESEIEKLLKGASEKECAKKPEAKEWSANEIIAHLIQDELAWQNVVTDIIGGNEGAYDDWGGNIQARIDATVATFHSKSDLFKELTSHDEETLRLLAGLPSDFLLHKGKLWKLTFQASQRSYHLETHLEQIRAAIRAAQEK